jgi:hypothetical protein
MMLPAPAGAAGVADVRTAADGATEIDWVV